MQTIGRMVFASLLMGCATDEVWLDMDLELGVPFATLDVDGSPMTCLIDTGSSIGLIVRSTIGLEEDVMIDFGARQSEAAANASPLLDPLLDALSTQDRLVDCIVGWPAFRPHATTFDYATSSWRVARSTRRSAEIEGAELGEPIVRPIFGTRYWAMTKMEVGGIEATAVVDTGASFMHLQPVIFDQLNPTPSTVPVLATTADGVLSARAGVLPTVELGNARQDDVWFSTSALPQITSTEGSSQEFEALVGASFLLNYAVTFDGPRGEMTLQPYPADTADALVGGLLADSGANSPTAWP